MNGVHPAANEAALRHLTAKLSNAELELAVAVGNNAALTARVRDLEKRNAEIEAQLPAKPVRPPGAPIGAQAIRRSLDAR